KPSADCRCGNERRECGSPEKDNLQSWEKSLAITPKRRNHDLQKDQPTKVFGVIRVTGTKHREICARGTTTHYDEEYCYFGNAISHAGLLPTIALPRQSPPRKLTLSEAGNSNQATFDGGSPTGYLGPRRPISHQNQGDLLSEFRGQHGIRLEQIKNSLLRDQSACEQEETCRYV